MVALFNAISKRQNQADGGGGTGGTGSSNLAGTAKAAAVKGASRHAFLDMLKTGVKPTEGAAAAAAEAGAAGGGKRGRDGGRGGAEATADGGGEVRMRAALPEGCVHRTSDTCV